MNDSIRNVIDVGHQPSIEGKKYTKTLLNVKIELIRNEVINNLLEERK